MEEEVVEVASCGECAEVGACLCGRVSEGLWWGRKGRRTFGAWSW